jgi:hypothetical protein
VDLEQDSPATKKQKYKLECVNTHTCNCPFCPIQSLNTWVDETSAAHSTGTFI